MATWRYVRDDDVTMDERGNLSTGELIVTYPVTIDDGNNVRVDINANAEDDEESDG